MTGIAALNGGAETYMLIDTLGFDDTPYCDGLEAESFSHSAFKCGDRLPMCNNYTAPGVRYVSEFRFIDEMLLKLPQTLPNALTSQTGRAKEYGLDGAVMGWSDTQRRVRFASFANENRFVLGFGPLVAAPLFFGATV